MRRRKIPIRTGDANTVNVVRDNTLPIHDIVELGSTSVEDDGVEPNAVQEAETQSQLIELGEDSTSNLDHGEFGGLGRVRRGGKNAKVALNLALGSNRIE